MDFEYRLTINDHLEANQAHFKSQSFLYVAVLGISTLCITAGLFYFVFGCILIPTQLMKGCLFAVLGLILVALGVFCNPYINPLRRYAIARSWKSQPDIHEPRAIQVTEDGIIVKFPTFQSTINWQDYTHFIETKNLFMVYQDRRVFNLFPKRAFSSDHQVNQFRELLEKNIEKFR